MSASRVSDVASRTASAPERASATNSRVPSGLTAIALPDGSPRPNSTGRFTQYAQFSEMSSTCTNAVVHSSADDVDAVW